MNYLLKITEKGYSETEWLWIDLTHGRALAQWDLTSAVSDPHGDGENPRRQGHWDRGSSRPGKAQSTGPELEATRARISTKISQFWPLNDGKIQVPSDPSLLFCSQNSRQRENSRMSE